ncbi:5'/3'-nucleotidase SurE [Thiosulfativibrio zosterae]|uniref:5'-nucleotidase SurE n=1 Tax=Thiosulfativibrio zosterae TaxID=2675053 RepID=A0A6F8PNS7_9GAMM|nr:5'/3'-nucleotidase SurE [Thiosulfativibrio zosterae]BBP43772.1 5'-nucleotidase SurE [Thiosulfativibrio zosterae]
MKLLLSNDDGYFAPGILCLAETLRQHPLCKSLTVIAPDRNRSAASNSLTLLDPLRMTQHSEGVYSVSGTPTDCVHLGVNGALDDDPDMVISGINAGANMGDDVLYSGTVAAATEGRFLGKPSIAISLCGYEHFATAAKVLAQVLSEFSHLPIESNTILNINVPNLPYEELKGLKITRLGRRHASEKVVRGNDPRGLPLFWIGPPGSAADASDGTDFDAIDKGYVSITPLQIDLTHYRMHTLLQSWAADFSLTPA